LRDAFAVEAKSRRNQIFGVLLSDPMTRPGNAFDGHVLGYLAVTVDG